MNGLDRCLQVHHVPRWLEKAADGPLGQDFPCMKHGPRSNRIHDLIIVQ